MIEGEIEAIVEGRSQRAGAGTLFSVPPGVEHTFNYHGPGGARMLNIHTPDDGFADFLRRVSE